MLVAIISLRNASLSLQYLYRHATALNLLTSLEDTASQPCNTLAVFRHSNLDADGPSAADLWARAEQIQRVPTTTCHLTAWIRRHDGLRKKVDEYGEYASDMSCRRLVGVTRGVLAPRTMLIGDAGKRPVFFGKERMSLYADV